MQKKCYHAKMKNFWNFEKAKNMFFIFNPKVINEFQHFFMRNSETKNNDYFWKFIKIWFFFFFFWKMWKFWHFLKENLKSMQNTWSKWFFITIVHLKIKIFSHQKSKSHKWVSTFVLWEIYENQLLIETKYLEKSRKIWFTFFLLKTSKISMKNTRKRWFFCKCSWKILENFIFLHFLYFQKSFFIVFTQFFPKKSSYNLSSKI